MTLETVITIQMISAGICTGVCLVVLIGAALDAIMSKKPGKIPQPKKTPPRGDNFIVCACADCVHHSVPAHNLRCCIDRTYITSDGKCISYVPRDSEIAKSGLKGATLSTTDHWPLTTDHYLAISQSCNLAILRSLLPQPILLPPFSSDPATLPDPPSAAARPAVPAPADVLHESAQSPILIADMPDRSRRFP